MGTLRHAQSLAPRARLSVDISPDLHERLKAAAARRHLSMSELLRELLENSLASLGDGAIACDDLDSMAVRRELAAASVNALGDFWDNEADAQWQTLELPIAR